MAKDKVQSWEIEEQRRREAVDWHRAEIPGNDDEPELIEQYGLTLERYHEAALRNDDQGMLDAALRMEAAVENLWCCPPGDRSNGPRDRFTCWAAAAEYLARQTAADDGEVPMYGQRGRFLLTIAGCRVDFEYDGLFGLCGGRARVVDLDRPFISETDFRSFQVCPRSYLVWTGGILLDAYLQRVCEKQLEGKPLVTIRPDEMMGNGDNAISRPNWIREQRAKDPAWQPGGYLADLPAAGFTGYVVREERTGQLALAF